MYEVFQLLTGSWFIGIASGDMVIRQSDIDYAREADAIEAVLLIEQFEED